jgi:type I restriction enzyme S subunit
MVSEWRELAVEEFADVVGGGTPSTADEQNFGGDIPWITPKDLSNYGFRYIEHGERNITQKGLSESNATLLPAGTVLLSTRAPVGYLAIAKNPLTTNQGFKSLIVRDGFDNEFVFYLLKANVEYLKSQASGTTFGELSGSTLRKLKFLLPPLPEQRAIAAVLGALDDKIELNRRMNRTLEAIAQAVFRHWFVENEEAEGWEVGRLGDDFNLTMGQSPPGETYNEDSEGIPFFQGRADFGFRFPNKRVYCTAPTRFAEPGDTLVSVRAPVGDMNMATEKCAIGRGLAAVRHKTGSRSYTYYAIRFIQESLFRFEGEGTVFGSITKADFENLQIIIPPVERIKEFEEVCFPIDEMIENNEQQSRTLAALRDALLPKLMRGEVRVHPVDG